MIRHPLRPALCTVLLSAGLSAHSGTPPSPAHPDLPAMQTNGILQYACGGVGSDESIALRAAMKRYPLSLLFARKDGDYLANVAVLVQPAHGDAMRFTASGPICLLQLPKGHYAIKATTQEGDSHTQMVHVARTGHTVEFRY